MNGSKRFLHLRIIFTGLLIPYLALAVLLKLLDPLMYARKSDKALLKEFTHSGKDVQIGFIQVEDRRIRYLVAGEDTLPTLVFIHGAPSSLSVGLDYLKNPDILKKARVIAYDRPGYGYSGLGIALTSIQAQAEVCERILEKFDNGKPVILVGTSFGGPVAAKVAMDMTTKIDGLALVSAAVAPGEERILPLSYIFDHWLFRWMTPRILRVANEEKLTHKSELQKMEPGWKNITAQVLQIHGDEDPLIYPSNTDFVKSRIPNGQYKLEIVEGGGHLISFNKKEWVTDQLLQFMEKVTETPLAEQTLFH